jgi:polysaccharide pyruvyl transferase WcaK-like protein
MSSERLRVVALAYQGFGNLGDEAILGGIEAILADTAVDVVTVCGGNRAPIAAFPHARRIVSRRLWPTPSSVLAIARARAVVVAGGGLLHDHWALVIPRYFAWTLLARLLRKRVIWVGVGVGPLHRRLFRGLAAVTLRLSKLVLVRDRASEATVYRIGGRVDGVIPDPALFLPVPPPGPGKDLAVVVRPPLNPDCAQTDRLRDALAGLIAEVASGGRRAAVLTFAGLRDREFATSVVEAARDRGAVDTTMEELAPDPALGLRRLAASEAVVTVRLHGMLLAAVAGRPFVVVGYDDKISAVAAELDAADLVVPLELADTATLLGALARAEEPGTRKRVEARVEVLRARRIEIAARLVGAVA